MVKLNEKFALIALPRANLADSVIDLLLPGGLRVERALPLQIEDNWQRWVGEIRTKQLQDAGCYLIVTRPTSSPEILDADNQELMQRVCRFLDALLIVNTPYCGAGPLLLTGANVSGETRMRQMSNLPMPIRRAYNQGAILQVLERQAFEQADVVADSLSNIVAKQGHMRLKRAISAFMAAIHETRHDERLHQFCRCIDGIVLSGKGTGKRDFKTRTALFVGTGHDAVTDEIYEMRSAVEHLRPAESEATGCSDLRAQRVRVIERAVHAELIARHCLNRILANSNLLQDFENDARIGQFWTEEECKRRAAWGQPLCFENELAGAVEAQHISDEDVGMPARHQDGDAT